jgi:hypothetical protein
MFEVHIRAALEFLTFTYVAGHLVIALAASSWEGKPNSRPLPRVKSDGSFDSAAVQFWPPDGFAVSCPRPTIPMKDDHDICWTIR